MPAIPNVCGLQSVDVEKGHCFIKAPGEPQRMWPTTPRIAAKLQAWLDGSDDRHLQHILPELTSTEREMMLTGYNEEQQARIFGE